MKADKGFALFFALSAVAIRLGAFYGGFISPETGQHIIIVHLLLLLLSVFFALRNVKGNSSNERELLMQDLKAGLKAAGVYALTITIFVWIYFKYIDTAYFISKQQELIAAQLAGGGEIEKVRANVESFFSLMNYTTVTLLGLFTIGMVYTLMLTVLNRFVLRKFQD